MERSVGCIGYVSNGMRCVIGVGIGVFNGVFCCKSNGVCVQEEGVFNTVRFDMGWGVYKRGEFSMEWDLIRDGIYTVKLRNGFHEGNLG